MALLFLLFVSPVSSISHNAESISHAFLFILGVFLPTLAAADNNDDGLVDYECNGVGIFFFGSIYIIDATLGLQEGGGIYASGATTITMTNCEISENTATSSVRFTIS